MTRKSVISATSPSLSLPQSERPNEGSLPRQGEVRTANLHTNALSRGNGVIPVQASGPSRNIVNVNANTTGMPDSACPPVGPQGPQQQRLALAYSSSFIKKATSGEKPPHERKPHPPPHLPHKASPILRDLMDYSDAGRTDVHGRLMMSLVSHYGESYRIAPLLLNFNLDMFGYFADPRNESSLVPLTDGKDGTGLSMMGYVGPARRSSQSTGYLVEEPSFAMFDMHHGKTGATFKAHFVQWAEGFSSYRMMYLVHDRGQRGDDEVEQLVISVGVYSTVLRNEVWVFDQGWWDKSAELWESIQKANWKDIILEDDLKEEIIADVSRFFRGKRTYEGLGVAWKRGILLTGPPGNGKTITLKALSKTLMSGDDNCASGESSSKPCLPFVPTLYVKTFTSFGGDEYSIKQVFAKAREQAPCILALEDLDAFITENNRSFFFNEVDGLIENDGIFIIASTNHPERLDPGITKRPSRFDRKYNFPLPGFPGRMDYCKYWQYKLRDTPIDFNDELLEELAQLMEGFSFAYMKEAFVSTLLVLAARREDDADGEVGNGPLPSLAETLTINSRGDDEAWAKDFEKVIKKQIETLREQIGDGN